MSDMNTANNLLISAFGAAAFGDDYQPHIIKDGTDFWGVFQNDDYIGYINEYDKGEYYASPISELRDPNHPERWMDPYPTLEAALADFTLGTRHPYRDGKRNGK